MDGGISSMILLISALVVSTITASIVITSSDTLSNVIDDKTQNQEEKLLTDISIISDVSANSIYNSNTDDITLLVKNTGDISLNQDDITVLVNGEFTTIQNTEILDDTDNKFEPGNVLRITLNKNLPQEENQVLIEINGVKKRLVF